MARKPADQVQLTLRFTEALRLRLEKAAEKNNRSLNEEIIRRLEASFAKEDTRQQMEEFADQIFERFGKTLTISVEGQGVVVKRNREQS
jgi:hypothetical protein